MSVLLRSLAILFALSVLCSTANAQSDSVAAKKPKYTMRMYQMVLISRGPNPPKDSITSKQVGEGHMANIKRMAEMGKLVLAGPFGDSGDLRGIFIMDVATKEEAERLCQDDPAIKSGAFSIEIKPWYGPAGLTYEGKE